MYIVILLAIALILAYFTRPKDKHSYHKAILAIFGIAYFVIWRFLEYYLNVFFVDDTTKNIIFLSLISFTVIVSVLPWLTQISQIKSYVFVAFFFVFLLLTFTLEKNIKFYIAEWGGYFDDATPQLTQTSERDSGVKYHHESGGFTVALPKVWQKNSNKLGMDYFTWKDKNKKLVELRPGCFHNSELSMPEIMLNIFNYETAQGQRIEKQCFKAEAKFLICFVRSIGNKEDGTKEKWRWIVTELNQKQNIELDFLFYNNELQTREKAKAVINSLEIIPLSDPLPLCTSSIDWF